MPLQASQMVWLLVEDDPNDVELFYRALKRCRFKVFLQDVPDAIAALDYLLGRGPYADRFRHPAPDLVVLDLVLPMVSGLEFLEMSRNTEECRQVPIVVLSGMLKGDPEQQQALERGASRVYLKPLDGTGLEQIVREIYALGLSCQAGAQPAETVGAPPDTHQIPSTPPPGLPRGR